MAEAHHRINKVRFLDQTNEASLPEEQRAPVTEMRHRKEGKPRKASHCYIGKPAVPPKRIRIEDASASGPTRVVLADEVHTPPQKKAKLVFTPSSENQEDAMVMFDENLIVDAKIEIIGFSPSTTSTTERPPSPSFLQDVVLNANFIVDAQIETGGISPSTTSTTEHPPSPSFAFTLPLPVPSTSSAEPDTATNDEDQEELEGSADGNNDSDVDYDDVGTFSGSRRRCADEYITENLSSELQQTLTDIDRRDDCALKNMVTSEMLEFDWSSNTKVFKGQREVFVGPAGPTFNAKDMSPFEVFEKIWDEDIINLIVTETNRYGARFRNQPGLSQHARIKRWQPVTAQDIWVYFGIMMLHSIVPIPVEREYWAPCLDYLKFGNFAEFMTFTRFQLIKRCLHFVDNNLCARGIPSKIAKIKPVLDHLNHKFRSLYLPGQEIALDESLLLWSGKLSFAQLIKTKAAEVGIKSHELCESRTGYLWNMLLYTGRHEGHNSGEAESEGATSRIVYDLVRPLLNKGHTLVMDNFYNSPLLARTLKAQKTDVLGTLRLNRANVPESLRHKDKSNMRPGEVAFSQTKDITITVWRDATVVGLISTYHKIEVGGKVKQGNFRYKPNVVLDYNMSMGGVDKKDQLLQAFPIERVRNAIWYKKVFRRLLNVSIHNAFVIFASARTGYIPQRQFRVQLADEIIKRFRPQGVQRALLPSNEDGGHYPVRNSSKQSRCKWCASKKVRTTTIWKCDTCNLNLCVLGCFRDYHLHMSIRNVI